MPAEMPRNFLTIPRFDEIPFLIHGFGGARLTERDFKARKEWADFRPVILSQVHSDIVHVIEEPPAEKLTGDGLVTASAGLFLIIGTADCLPVLLVDEVRRVIASVHCGWRGTRKRILEKAIGIMVSRFGVASSSLLAAFGPCIGSGCYEVGEDVRAAFAAAEFPAAVIQPRTGRPGKYLLDLIEANRGLLLSSGVPPDRIFTANTCTHCDDRFLSFRRDRIKTGRMLNFIGMKPFSK